MTRDIAVYIKNRLKQRGTSFSELARNAGFSASEVQGSLYRPIFFGEQIIAEFLNIHPMQLWPNRYDENGRPLHPHASAKKLKPFCPKSKEK